MWYTTYWVHLLAEYFGCSSTHRIHFYLRLCIIVNGWAQNEVSSFPRYPAKGRRAPPGPDRMQAAPLESFGNLWNAKFMNAHAYSEIRQVLQVSWKTKMKANVIYYDLLCRYSKMRVKYELTWRTINGRNWLGRYKNNKKKLKSRLLAAVNHQPFSAKASLQSWKDSNTTSSVIFVFVSWNTLKEISYAMYAVHLILAI